MHYVLDANCWSIVVKETAQIVTHRDVTLRRAQLVTEWRHVHTERQRWLSHWRQCWHFKGIHWFQLHHSHQASPWTLTLVSRFKLVLDRFKSVNAGGQCEHGLKGLFTRSVRVNAATILRWCWRYCYYWIQWSHSRMGLQPIFERLHCFQWEQYH